MTHDKLVKVSFCGDIMCLREETEARRQRFGRLDYTDYVSSVRPLLNNSDYVVGNLETPVSMSHDLSTEAINFNSPIDFLQVVGDVGFNFLSTANNHCLDRGVSGIEETIKAIDSLGIKHDGTYLSRDDAEALRVVDVARVKIAIICSTFGTNSQHNGVVLAKEDEWRVALLKKQPKKKHYPFRFDSKQNELEYLADDVSPVAISNPVNEAYLSNILSKINQAKQIADIVVAMPHVGGQYNPAPATYAKYVIGKMKYAGADMIIAGHSHTPHRCEWLDSCFIAYSLGNLCFTPNVGFYVRNVLADYGIVLHVYIDVVTKKLTALLLMSSRT